MRWADRSQLPEDEAEQGAGGGDDHIVDGGGENASAQGRTLQRDVDAWTLLHFGLLGRLDGDSAESRRRWNNIRRFQDAGTG